MIGDPDDNARFWTCGRYYNTGNSTYYFSVSKSTNSGTSWTRYNPGTLAGYAYTLAMSPVSSGTVYAGGQENNLPAVYRTTDTGASWSKLAGTGLSGTVNTLAFHPRDQAMMYAGTSVNLYRSTDGGNTWSTTGFAGGHTKTICALDLGFEVIIYAGTNTQGVYQSTDDGATWVQNNDGLGNLTINSLKAANTGQYLYAGTTGSSAFRLLLPNDVVEEGGTGVAGRDIGLAISPNPTAGKTVLSYAVPAAGRFELAIYSIDGREITTLANGVREPGIYQARWNGCDSSGKPVAAGVYICRLATDRGTAVRKMVVLK